MRPVPAAPNPRLRLIHGDERFLVDREVAVWRAAAASGELDVEVFDAPARLGPLRRSVMEVPFLDPERSIIVRDPPQLTGGARRGADPPEELASLLADAAPTTSLCLIAHARVPAQNPVLVAARRLGAVITLHSAPRGREVRAWVEAAIRERHLRVPPGTADHLLSTVGTDLGALSGELDKLAALARARPLTHVDVERLVAGDEGAELWEVLEHLLGASPARGAATLASLLDEGRSSQHLLAILGGQARDLLLVQSLLQAGRRTAAVAAELHIPEWRAERLSRQARSVPAATLAGWVQRLHDADRRAKAGEISDSEALRVFALHAAAEVTATRA
jgi:DNA polymerase-3 subunit delta